ncbi:MAG TPA: type II toxin-antitoxin system RelE/ParE family toxin [Flavobacteriaceae bacterium]|nr:type II toxin-antitoxin system RelE/ParE family toxin [Flavobacteriaceae bacterium]
MSERVKKVIWTPTAKKKLNSILSYRYAKIPSAWEIVENDIISTSRNIVFSEQYQKDDIYPTYRKIIVRDYKILYRHEEEVVFIVNIVCTRAGKN